MELFCDNIYLKILNKLASWWQMMSHRLYTSESDVWRRQILTYKGDLRAERTQNISPDRKPIT